MALFGGLSLAVRTFGDDSAAALAKKALQARVWPTASVCYATEGTAGFKGQWDRPLYQAALTTEDERIQALLAMRALTETHRLDMPLDPSASSEVSTTRRRALEDYLRIERWYWHLTKAAQSSTNAPELTHLISGGTVMKEVECTTNAAVERSNNRGQCKFDPRRAKG